MGAAYEYLRNKVLNANDYFTNLQSCLVLRWSRTNLAVPLVVRWSKTGRFSSEVLSASHQQRNPSGIIHSSNRGGIGG